MGAHGVVLPQRRSAGLTGSAAKVAAGALEHLPVARVVNLNRSLEKLKDAGYRVIGLAGEGDVTLPDADLSGPLVLVTGSEDQGLSLLTRYCDQLVRIRCVRDANLNASVAASALRVRGGASQLDEGHSRSSLRRRRFSGRAWLASATMTSLRSLMPRRYPNSGLSWSLNEVTVLQNAILTRASSFLPR